MLGQRKPEAGIDQQRGFTGPGCTDDDVPGQFIQKLPVPPALLACLFEKLQRFFKLPSQDGGFLGLGLVDGGLDRIDRRSRQVGHELSILLF